jgi:hypothetical protein
MHHEQEQQNGCNPLFPRDIVCLRNISINTLHKGDDDDNCRRATTLYTLGTWVVTGICVNTLHKDDDDDDDDEDDDDDDDDDNG